MSGFVYFIRPAGMLGPIKIGFSEAPTSRLETLAAWSPFKLEIAATIPGSRLLESSIHDCFGDDWSHREWFFPSRRLVEFVTRIAAGVPIENAVDLNDKRGKRPRRGAEISESDKLCSNYNQRLAGACRRAQNALGPKWTVGEPDFVAAIMRPWRGSYRGGRSQRGPQPTATQLAEVDRFLHDPSNLGKVFRRGVISPLVSPADPAQPASEPAREVA